LRLVFTTRGHIQHPYISDAYINLELQRTAINQNPAARLLLAEGLLSDENMSHYDQLLTIRIPQRIHQIMGQVATEADAAALQDLLSYQRQLHSLDATLAGLETSTEVEQYRAMLVAI
jgi:hypothetical protein